MSYRGFHVLEDKPNKLTLELRETWIDPDKDIWRWKMYVSEPHKPLRVIGSLEGYETLSEVLYCASIEFRDHAIRVKKETQQALYYHTESEVLGFSPSKQLLLQQLKQAYDIAKIDPNRHIGLSDKVRDYVRARAQHTCNLMGSNDFSVGCYMYKGKMVCRCNNQEFVVDMLADSTPRYVLTDYYCFILYRARLIPNAKSKTIDFVPLRTLLKHIKAEAKQ